MTSSCSMGLCRVTSKTIFCWICLISICEGLQIHCDIPLALSNLKRNYRLSGNQSWNQSTKHSEFPTRSQPLLFTTDKSIKLCHSNQSENCFTSTSLALSLRNGAKSDDSEDVTVKQRIRTVRKYAATILSIAFLSYFLWSNDAVRSFDLRAWLIHNLDYANSFGTVGIICYSFAFALWEILVGVTTPVETAAGMAFGVKRGIIGNACGKLGGAIIAFLIGRFVLKDFVSKKLENNEMMGLVRESIESNPIGVALIWRFSFLPEFVKNFGLAVMPLKTVHFITAVFLHGFPFTCLWTFMGAEADMLVRGVVSQPSKILKVMVSGVYVFGFIISPTLVGLWVKSLKDRQKERNKK